MTLTIPSRRVVAFYAPVIVIAVLPALPAHADRFEWTNAVDGDFDDAGKWNNTIGGDLPPPNTGDEIEFNEGGFYTVTLNQDESVDLIRGFGGNVTLASDSSTVRTLKVTTGLMDLLVRNGGILNIGSATNPVFVNVGDQAAIGTGTGSGTVVVSGFGSRLDALGSGDHSVGSSGFIGSLTVADGATANYSINGTLQLGISGIATTEGTVLVDSGGTLNTGHINIATIDSGATGTMTVSGADSLIEQTLVGAVLDIGSATNGVGTLDVLNSGTFTAGSGATTINATGVVNITDGTFETNGTTTIESGGSVTLDGGVINANAGLDNSLGGTLNLQDGTLTVTGGEFIPTPANDPNDYVIDSSSPADEAHLVIGTGASASFEGASNRRLVIGLNNKGGMTVSGGGTVDSGSFDIDTVGGSGGGTGRVTVTGAGSSWSPSTVLLGTGSGAGRVEALDGGTVQVGTTQMGFNLAGAAMSSLSVDGAGSQYNTGNLFIASTANSDASVSITNGGRLTSGLSGLSSQIAPGDNTDANVLIQGAGATWDVNGDLSVGGDLGLASNGASAEVDIRTGGLLNVSGTIRNWPTATITLDGGQITTNVFNNAPGTLISNPNGNFNFISGTLIIKSSLLIGDSSRRLFEDSFTINPERTIGTDGTTTIAANHSLTFNGGTLITHNLNVNGFFNFDRGTLELTGGTISGLSQLNVPTDSHLKAVGTYELPLSAASGSSITATGILSLGDPSAANGFYANGTISVLGGNILTLQDANDAVLDSGAAVTLGDTTQGTIAAANGLALDFGGNIAGFGTVNTPDDPARPLINNGNITGNSVAEPITLTGHVKGVGTCDNCNITGTDAPGFSPATVIRGSVSYNGTLEIDVEGTAPGQFDRIEHILGGGVADLGGTLDVLADPALNLAAGDFMQFIYAQGGIFNEFQAVSLPTFNNGTALRLVYGETLVALEVFLPGDFNADGAVDSADYSVWLAALGDSNESLINNNGDGDGVTIADYNLWKSNFGNSLGTGSSRSTEVPEPSAPMLILLGTLFLLFRQTTNF